MKTRRQELEDLDKKTLIDIQLLLEKRIRSLEKQVGDLRGLLQSAKPKTSENSSVPPSQVRKPQVLPKGGKAGAKVGHVGSSRRRTEPDEIIECRVAACGQCGWDLSSLPQHLAGQHQVTDLPVQSVIVREVRRYGRYCPACHSYQRAEAPAGFETGRVLGPNLERLILYLHQAHPLSYGRVQRILQEVYGLRLQVGSLVNSVQRAATRLKTAADDILRQLKTSAVIGSDETGARVAGATHWQWVFQNQQWAYYRIVPSRSAQVIKQVMGEAVPQVWISDVLSSQMCHPAQAYQICLAHQVRDLQYALDTSGCDWARQMQTLFYQTMAFVKQRPTLAAQTCERHRHDLEDQLAALLETYPTPPDSQRLWRRYHKHRAALLLCLTRADVPATNNASEQALEAV